MTRRRVLIAALAAVVALSAAAAGRAHQARDGGTFLMATDGPQFDSVDPAVSVFVATIPVFQATCGQLLRTPDEPLPAAYRMVPEIATGFPTITDGGRTYTFTIRKDVRFETGAVVTARDFAATLNRIFNPALKSVHAAELSGIVGSDQVLAGRAKSASGIVATGNRLTIKLKQPSGAFLPLMASLDSCVLPATLPADSEGVTAPVPSAGPYYTSEFVPGQRVVLERNRFYAGSRPHHFDRIVIDLAQDLPTVLDKVERGDLDYAWGAPILYSLRAEELRQKYGVNRSRFFVSPGGLLRLFVFNTSSPLLRNNPKLRQAINFAIDRKALAAEWGPLAGILTDQYLPPGYPGYRNVDIYPLKGPDVAKAKALAKGHTRSGRLVVLLPDFPFAVAQGAIIKSDLAKIGLTVEVDAFPPSIFFVKGQKPGPYDLKWSGAGSVPPDAAMVEGVVKDSYLVSPKYAGRFAEASRLPYGPERNRAYGQLDVDLTRDVAPAVAYSFDTAMTLVAPRIGCVVVNPWLDLAAVCLR